LRKEGRRKGGGKERGEGEKRKTRSNGMGKERGRKIGSMGERIDANRKAG
jgi:hypothetical protein